MPKTVGVEASPAGSRTEPLPDPIQFILQEHDRQLEACSGLEKLVSALPVEPVTEWAASLLAFLTKDLALHVQDEELDLFPKLLTRRPATGNLGEILEQLASEHEVDEGLADLVISDLEDVARGDPPEHPLRFQMNVRAFCEMQRRHLSWENNVVLPLAQTLLTEGDRQELAQRMVARRSAP